MTMILKISNVRKIVGANLVFALFPVDLDIPGDHKDRPYGVNK